MRIRHPVQQHDQRRTGTADADLVQIAPVQRARFQRGPLMHRTLVNGHVEAAWIDDFRGHATGRYGLAQLVGGVLGQHKAQALARRVHQRIAHGVQAEQPDRLARLAAAGPFLVNHPGRFLHCSILVSGRRMRRGPGLRKGKDRRVGAATFALDAPWTLRYPPHRRATSCKVRQRTVTPPGRPTPGSIPGSPTIVPPGPWWARQTPTPHLLNAWCGHPRRRGAATLSAGSPVRRLR